MGIVATGAFRIIRNGLEVRFTRAELHLLVGTVGWSLDDRVHSLTIALYAADVSGNSSKLRDARMYNVPICTYATLYSDLQARLTSRNDGVTILPEHALERMKLYGIANWRSSSASRLQTAQENQEERKFAASLKKGMEAAKKIEQQAKPGQLHIKRVVKL